jgi:hypothetical protein
VNTNGAGSRGLGDGGLGLGWVDDSDTGGTTALRVLDDRTGAAASGGMLTGGSTWHIIVELEITVELGRDVDLSYGHSLGGVGSAAT